VRKCQKVLSQSLHSRVILIAVCSLFFRDSILPTN
jgi:hypothetical protein